MPGLDDVGKQISVRIRLSHQAYRDETVLAAAAGPIRTRPTLSVWTEGRPRRAVVRLKVTAPGVETPGGRATVRIGRDRVAGRLEDGVGASCSWCRSEPPTVRVPRGPTGPAEWRYHGAGAAALPGRAGVPAPPVALRVPGACALLGPRSARWRARE